MGWTHQINVYVWIMQNELRCPSLCLTTMGMSADQKIAITGKFSLCHTQISFPIHAPWTRKCATCATSSVTFVYSLKDSIVVLI